MVEHTPFEWHEDLVTPETVDPGPAYIKFLVTAIDYNPTMTALGYSVEKWKRLAPDALVAVALLMVEEIGHDRDWRRATMDRLRLGLSGRRGQLVLEFGSILVPNLMLVISEHAMARGITWGAAFIELRTSGTIELRTHQITTGAWYVASEG